MYRPPSYSKCTKAVVLPEDSVTHTGIHITFLILTIKKHVMDVLHSPWCFNFSQPAAIALTSCHRLLLMSCLIILSILTYIDIYSY